VFDRFYRLDAAARPPAGLGLALVKAIATLHGLSLRLEDRQPGLAVIATSA
jgi:Osmosensitive K+ channel histidine kinase